MGVIRYDQVDLQSIRMEDADGVSRAVAIGRSEGWDGYVMRLVRLAGGGHTPKHSHDWEHVVYVIEGRSRLTIGSEVYELAERDFAFIPPGVEHQFENRGSDEFEFLCVVPERGES